MIMLRKNCLLTTRDILFILHRVFLRRLLNYQHRQSASYVIDEKMDRTFKMTHMNFRHSTFRKKLQFF